MARFRKRKGVAEIIGGLFILALLVTVMGFSALVFGAYQNYQSALDSRAAYQSAKGAEQMSGMSVTFSANAVQVSAANGGGAPLHFVSLWVAEGPNVAHFDRTMSGTGKFDVWVAPGQTASVSAPYAWAPGSVFVELVTEHGNVFAKVVPTP